MIHQHWGKVYSNRSSQSLSTQRLTGVSKLKLPDRGNEALGVTMKVKEAMGE